MDKLKYLGYVLIVWGVADIVLSYMGTDVWGEWFGIQLEGFLYQWSGAIAIVIGGLIVKFGSGGKEESEAGKAE